MSTDDGLGRRNYDRFITLLVEKSLVDEPIKALLPNAEAIDPFKIPVGNVIEVAANSPLVSELLHRAPVTAIAVMDLSELHINAANVTSVMDKLKSIVPEVMASKEPFTLGLGDQEHWEANLVNGRFSIIRTKTQNKPKMTGATNHQLHKQGLQKGARSSGLAPDGGDSTRTSFLSSALAEPEPSYSYSMVAMSEASGQLMSEYGSLIEASCQTAGQIASHPSTQILQSHLTRNNNRILQQIGELMGWNFPCQVDASSVFHNKAEFSAPLMAVPTHTQINNSVTMVGETVRFFNGAIDMLQSGGLESAFVDLGLDVGMAQFSVPIRHVALALPISVRREPIGRTFASTAKPIGNLIGADQGALMFKQGYYQKPTEEFISQCQKLAGNTDELMVAPCIFTSLLTIVGEQYGR